MFKNIFWLFLSSFITLTSSKVNYAQLPDKVKEDIRQKWKECCKINTCINNACFIIQWEPAGWPTARQRCQSQYPEWPYSVDIFRIQNESDLRTFWNMLQEPVVPPREKVRTLWTSGVRCPKSSSDVPKFETRWSSTNEPFPFWLEKSINHSSKTSSKHSNSCEFLVLLPATDATNVEFDFQNQNARHSSICEFTVPDVEWTTRAVISSQSITDETTVISTESQPVTNVLTTNNDVMTITSSEPIIESETSLHPETPQTDTSIFQESSTNSQVYCSGLNNSGIYWPDTLPGETVQARCPEEMIGFAEWKCDEESLQFKPEKPDMEGCKHVWIDDIEKSIKNQDDAVDISKRLSKETKHNTMSHGDIIAIVNLTASLFRLYTEQWKEEEFEVSQSEEKPRYYNFTKSMISSISNMFREEIKDAWEGLNETRQTKEASTILRLVTTIGSRLSCIKRSTDKLQFTVSEDNIDLQTFILNNTSEDNGVMKFPQETESVKASSSITLPANFNFTKWLSPCKTHSSAVGVVYKEVGEFLKSGQETRTSTRVATEVLSFSVSKSTESIPLQGGTVNITLQHLKKIFIKDQILSNPRCVFWNFSKSIFGEWDSSGCGMVFINETHTVCQCNHLTNFAVLMDINDNIDDNKTLTWMTRICCGLSAVTLFLTLICFLTIRSLHGRRSIITGNLCLSLLVSNGLIIFGLDKTEDKIICSIVAGVLHFWILSAFCWMLVEGYHLYRMVILVFQRGANLSVKFYYLFAYGSPLIVVGISAGIRTEGYGGERYCWLSPKDRGVMWSFVGPACAIILINIVIFILTLRSASSVKIKREQSTVKKIKSWIRGSISVMCLLGLTWSIGLFYTDKNLHFFSYIFIILNGLQGVFIFFFHILLNDKVNSAFSCKNGRKKFFNHVSSNQTHSKTSTRTSTNSLGCTSSTKVPNNRISMNNNQGSSVVLNSRISVTSNNRINNSDAIKRNNETSKGTKGASIKEGSQTSFYNNIVRIRSQSASKFYSSGKDSQSNLTSL